jgi:molybdopterin-binding protein
MPRLLTSTQVCQLLNISSKTLYQWEADGKIPRSTRDRRGWRRYSPRQVEAIRKYAGPTAGEERGGGAPASGKAPAAASSAPEPLHGLSARNQLRGTVVSIAAEGLLAEVVLQLADGQEIVAVVTRSSVRRLGLRKGGSATAVIKATEVMVFS